ncbi:MAG: PKD-like domain-containing protein [Cyclobacteriaceae bacterium]
MNQRMWRTVFRSLVLTVLALGFVVGEVWAQASFVSARHETLSQREIDVTFNAGISFAGVPTSVGWFVEVNGTNVPITSIGTFGPTVVRIQFNASAIAGHGGTQAFVKPGEVLRVRYAGGGNFNAPGVNSFGFQTSQNNTPFTCSEMEFFQQGNFASVDVCLPVVMNFRQYQYRTSLKFRNSSLFNLTNFRTNIAWGDATSTTGIAFYISDLVGTPDPTFIDNNGFFGGNPGIVLTQRPTKTYNPPNPTDCSFDANILPLYNGVAFCPSISTTTIYPAYDTDNANSGALALEPSPLPTSNQVCLGTNANMQFNDATSLNCRSAIEPIVPNEGQRHIRVVYGSTNYGAPGNIPDVRVTLPAVLGGGTTQVTNNNATGTRVAGAFTPTSVGVADFNGVIPIASPVTAATALTYMGQITTTQTNNQAVGQRFYVRLDYWDVCNPYNAGDPTNPAPVSIENYVVVVDAPPIPAVAYTANHCDTDGNGTFTITATRTQAGSTLRWYRDAALTDLEKSSTGSATFNPITEGSPALVKATTSAERVINYYVTEQWGTGLNCTSPVQTITFRITDTNNGGTIDHPNEIGTTQVVAICTGDNPPAFTNAGSATGGDGTNYNYQWEQSTTSAVAGFSNIGGATGTTYNPPALATTTWYRRRVSSGYCNDAYSNVFQIRVDVPVVGGAINGNQTICETPGNPGNLSNNTLASGGDGSNYAYQWEESTVGAGGPYNTIGGATGTSYNPPAGVTVTTYYRRRVTSGVCTAGSNNIAYSNVVTVTVDQDVDPGSIGNAQTICSTDDPAAISSVAPASGGDGSSYSYQWQQSTTSAVAGFGNIGGATSTTFDPAALTQTTWYRRVASSGVCSSENSNVIEITVTPLPTASNPTGGGAVCAGNPAPDIVWTLTGRPPFDISYSVTLNGGPPVFNVNVNNYTPPEAFAPYTFTISNPNPPVDFAQPVVPGDTYVYQMTVLDDDVVATSPSCTATALGSTATVTIGGTPPSFDSGPTLAVSSVCDDGGATSDPVLNFSLDAASASLVGFTLRYTVDGSAIRTKTFNTDAAGDPTLPVTFNDAEFNSIVPTPHVLTIVSIISPSACLSVFNTPLNFTVVPRPPPPAGAMNTIACSDVINTASISVTNPGAGFTIDWYDMATGGALLLASNNTFTPGAANAPAPGATATFYAETRETGSGLNCVSTSRTAVTLTSDARPADPVVGAPQTTCSDAALLSGNAATNGGTGTWSVGGIIYYETFSSADNGVGATGGSATTSPSSGNWTVDISNGILIDGNDHIRVQGGQLVAQDTDNDGGGQYVDWVSKVIDISAFPGGVDFSVDVSSTGAAGDDGVEFYYRLNGGGLISFNPAIPVPIAAQTVTESGVIGNDIQIVLRVELAGNGQFIQFDNVIVKSSAVSGAPIIADVNDPTSAVSNLQDGVNTFTWTITSALGACALPPAMLTITKNPQPTTADINISLCETTFGSGTTNAYDLNAHNAAVSNSVPDRTVTWFLDANLTMPVATPANVNINDTDVYYARVVNDLTSCDNVTPVLNPGSVTFTVNPLPVANNQIFSVCEETVGSANKDNNNLPALFDNLVTGGAASRTVDWYFDPGGAVTSPADLPIGLLLTPAEEVDQDGVTDGTIFYALVTNTVTMCQNVASVEFNIQTRPTANPIVGQPNVCASNALVVYQLTNIVPGSTYSWTLPPNNPGFFEVVFGGGVNDFFVGLRFPGLTAPPASDLYTISVIETSPVASGACAGDPNVFIISVDSSPAVNPITGPRPVCKNQNGVVYQVQSPNASNTYAWSITAGDAAIVGPAAGVGRTSIVVDFGVSNSSTISVVESSPSGCSLAAAQTYIVSAADNPAMTSTSNYTLCSGDAPATAPIPLIFTAAPGGNTFTWRAINVPAAVSGVALNDSGPGNIPNTLTNVSGVDAIVTFEVTPISTAAPFCPGPKQTVFVTVKPQPIINPGQTKLICNNTAVNYSIQLTPALLPNTTTFSWAAPTMSDASVQGAAEPGIAVGPAGTLHITDVLTNATNSTITATYNVVPSNGTCAYPAVPVVITIEPAPVVAAINNATTICNGASPDIDVTSLTVPSVPGNLTFDVTVSSSDLPSTGGSAFVNQLGLTAPFDIDAVDGVLTNSSNADLTVTYTITPKLAGCANGTPVLVNVIVEPTPVVAAVNNAATICNGASPDIDVTSLTVPSVPGNLTFDVTVSSSDLANTGGSAFVNQLGLTAPFDIDAVDGVLTNSSNTDITVTYTITPKLAGCTDGTPVLVNVIVEPTPVVAAVNNAATICNGASPDIDVTSLTVPSVPGNLTFDVTVSSSDLANTGGSAFVDQLGLTAPFDIDAVDGVLTNSSNADLTVTYTITPKLAGCADGTPVLVNVIVEPTPVVAAVNNATTICNGASPVRFSQYRGLSLC